MKDPRLLLETIPGFAGARVLSQLSDGPSNNSYEVEQGGDSFVLRIDKSAAVQLGLNRHAEKQVCLRLAEAELVPQPVYYDAGAGVYLRRFVPGRTWARQDLDDPRKLERLAILLREVHSLSPAGIPFEPLLAAARYAKQMDTPEASLLYDEAARYFTAFEPLSPVLCHNDLVCQNMIENEKLQLIDWEYAGVGDPFFDLAVVVQHHELEKGLARHFLDAYLQEEAPEADIIRLEAQCRFYQSLLNLWNLRVASF